MYVSMNKLIKPHLNSKNYQHINLLYLQLLNNLNNKLTSNASVTGQRYEHELLQLSSLIE